LKLDRAELLRVEGQLLAGQVSAEALPLLLESVRHMQRCGQRRGAVTTSTERRRKRGSKENQPKGHGRNGADTYSGARRVGVPHPDLKVGDDCPEAGCYGKVYDMSAPATHVELKGVTPVVATRYECQVLRCADCLQTFTAPLPAEATGAKYHGSVDATLAVARYDLGLPHNRLEQWQRRAGIPLPASTQFERVEVMANAASPVVWHLEQLAANRPLLQSDDTGARILSLQLENQTRGAQERTGLFTTGIVAKGVGDELPTIVLYASGRRHAGENLDRLLSRRAAEAGSPIHMADASSMAPHLDRIAAKCLAHARRYFIEIYVAFPEHCERVLSDIATVYQHDHAARDLDPAARLAYHQEHSRPLLNTLRAWIDEQFQECLIEPNSRLGKAFAYVKNHWPGLTRFLEVAGVPLDNNQTERELKPAQRHRKNSLFFKNEFGAAVGDVLLSVIRTCTINGHDPVRYLSALATHKARVRASPQEWLPWNYEQQLSAIK
jgi:transposase